MSRHTIVLLVGRLCVELLNSFDA